MASITTFFGAQGGGGSISGTLGQVAYFDGTDSIVGTDTFYWDNSGGPVKGLIIGSLTPSQGGGAGATSRLDLHGSNDLGSRVFAVYTGSVLGSNNIMRLFERGTLALTSNIGTGGETQNIFIGDAAIGENVTISGTPSGTALRNVAIGHKELSSGENAPGYALSVGDDNVLIGTEAGCRINSGGQNIVIGRRAGYALTSTGSNILIGANAGGAVTGSSTVFIGSSAGFLTVAGTGCTGVGVDALNAQTAGTFNTAFGNGAGASVQTTNENTFIGFNAGRYRGTGTFTNTAPAQCIYLGANSRAETNGTATNEIVIGYNAVGNSSNSVTLGNTSIANTYLRGNINLTDGGNIVAGTSTGTKIGTSASQKLALYGNTPIVQPTTSVGSATISSPGAGNTIKTDDTFDGYTLAKVVKALRELGILQ